MFGACAVRLWSHVVSPVFRELLCLGECVSSYALEALVTVGHVALPTCGGRSGALCLRASKSQYGGCALEAAGFPHVLLVWVFGGESLSVALGSFRAVGAVVYCTLSVFSFRCFASLCLEGSRLVWPVLPFQACGFLRVAFGRSLMESPSC
ncbi:hypothetical protein Taro_032377 [Colocasia esculenta]|uniref:Uncharacterized protein n=1 Tax=Colocasia esculenta TaxID=4460 RepID=A0A843W5Z0_COLES|nr:hypothetical protein [Colocasia esculenta]